MATLKYRVILTSEERAGLDQRIRRGHDSARRLTRARILLKADAGKGETEIAEALEVSVVMVEQVRRRFCEGRLQRALFDKPRPGRPAQARRQTGSASDCGGVLDAAQWAGTLDAQAVGG